MTNKKLLTILTCIVLFVLAVFVAIVVIKFSYQKGFTRECYRACYYNQDNDLWEYRPWGYDTKYTEEDRDFPKQPYCLDYCLSQKEIDFIQ